MDTIKRRLKQPEGHFAEQEFVIYERSEAEREGIVFKEDWRDCRAGDWGLTDDGYVMQCRAWAEKAALIKNRRSGNGKRKEHIRKRYYKFAVGEPIVTHNRNTDNTNRPAFEYLPYKENGGYSHPKAKTHTQHDASRKTTKRAMELYVDLHTSNNGVLTWDQWLAVGATFRTNRPDKYSVNNFKAFLKTNEGQKMFMETLKEALDKKGITYDSALAKMDETYEKAKKADHTQVMRGVYKDQLDLIQQADGTRKLLQEDSGYDFSLLLEKMEDEMHIPSSETMIEEAELVEIGSVSSS